MMERNGSNDDGHTVAERQTPVPSDDGCNQSDSVVNDRPAVAEISTTQDSTAATSSTDKSSGMILNLGYN